MSLIKEAKNKDPDAFDRLLRPQLGKMYRISVCMLENEYDAADAVQETVLKCWQKLGQLRNDDYFETWLIRILINQCNSMLRSRKKILYTADIPEQAREDHYFADDWKTMLAGLNREYRIVLELYYADGFSTKEIAKMLHISDANVRTRMSRGRRQLEQILKKTPD